MVLPPGRTYPRAQPPDRRPVSVQVQQRRSGPHNARRRCLPQSPAQGSEVLPQGRPQAPEPSLTGSGAATRFLAEVEGWFGETARGLRPGSAGHQLNNRGGAITTASPPRVPDEEGSRRNGSHGQRKDEAIVSTQDATAEQVRATVPQVLANLIVIGQTFGLPDPDYIDATSSNGIVSIGFLSREQLDAWRFRLDHERPVDSQQLTHPDRAGEWLHTCYIRCVKGWTVHLTARTLGAGTSEDIRSTDLATLEKLAAVQQ